MRQRHARTPSETLQRQVARGTSHQQKPNGACARFESRATVAVFAQNEARRGNAKQAKAKQVQKYSFGLQRQLVGILASSLTLMSVARSCHQDSFFANA
jgi:hypothetical protein